MSFCFLVHLTIPQQIAPDWNPATLITYSLSHCLQFTVPCFNSVTSFSHLIRSLCFRNEYSNTSIGELALRHLAAISGLSWFAGKIRISCTPFDCIISVHPFYKWPLLMGGVSERKRPNGCAPGRFQIFCSSSLGSSGMLQPR